MSEKNPLQDWQGQFGESYLGRNQPSDQTTAEAAAVFGRMLSSVAAEVGSALEIGANLGINLRGLRRVLRPDATLTALEPFAQAVAELRRQKESLGLTDILEASAYEIPVADGAFDLTFTNGVLIHIPPDKLPIAMREIVRASRRFVLCSEYFSHTPVEIPYHGQSGMLWKRDFGQAYLDTCPGLTVHSYGFTWQTEFPHYDNLNWWLFEKASPHA
jgi:pseudaminic acid biosynthesis-associated methylase